MITLDIVAGTPVTGLWCETCLLPSRYEVPLHILTADGPQCIGILTGCDGHDA